MSQKLPSKTPPSQIHMPSKTPAETSPPSKVRILPARPLPFSCQDRSPSTLSPLPRAKAHALNHRPRTLQPKAPLNQDSHPMKTSTDTPDQDYPHPDPRRPRPPPTEPDPYPTMTSSTPSANIIPHSPRSPFPRPLPPPRPPFPPHDQLGQKPLPPTSSQTRPHIRQRLSPSLPPRLPFPSPPSSNPTCFDQPRSLDLQLSYAGAYPTKCCSYAPKYANAKYI